MASISSRPLQIVGGAKIIHLPEDASQSFKKGQIIKVASDVLTATTDAADVQLVIAAEDATGTTGNLTAVYKVLPQTEIEANLSGTAAATDQNAAFGITTTSNITTLVRTDTTNRRFKVSQVGLAPTIINGAAGDTNWRVRAFPVFELASVDATTVDVGVGDTGSIWY